jgi:hypothetical protein
MFAVEIGWDSSIPIRQGGNIEWQRSAAVTSDGNIVYIWSDTRRGDRDVWAQKVDSSGNTMWADGGILVNGYTDRQEDPVGIGTTDGGVIIAWIDFRNEETGDVYAQKINANGETQWNTDGIPVTVTTGMQISLNMIQDLSGGAYLVWEDQRNVDGDIYGAHLDANGNNLWTVNGLPVASGAGEQLGDTFWEDGQGGGIMGYISNQSNKDIRACRVTSDGTIPWDVPVCTAANDQEEVKMAKDGDETFIFTWRDRRSDASGDIYAQRINLSGTLLWTNPVVVCGLTSKQENPRITSNGDGFSYLTWQDNRLEEVSLDLFAQKINTDGTLMWTADGLCITNYEGQQIDSRLVPDGNGGCVIAWVDERELGHPNEDILMQHVNSNGTVAWEANGRFLCNATYWQFGVLIKRSADRYYISWGDQRDGSFAIYHQVLDASGTQLLETNGRQLVWGLSGLTTDMSMKPSGDDAVIVWKDTRYPNATKNFVQILEPSGTTRFAENGLAITTTSYPQDPADTYINSDGSMMFVWPQQMEGYQKVFVQSIASDGTRQFGEGGLAVSDQSNAQAYCQIEKIGSDYLIGWSNMIYANFTFKYHLFVQKLSGQTFPWGTTGHDLATGNNDIFLKDIVDHYLIWQDQYDVFALRVDNDGNPATGWPTNGLLLSDGSDMTIQMNPKGVLTADGGIIICWEDTASGSSSIYGQYITADGQIHWQANGLPLADYPNDQEAADLITDGNDNYYMAWADFRTGTEHDIYMQKFNLSGTLLWNANGVALCDKDSTQTNPAICFTRDADSEVVLAVWEDLLTDYADIYSQTVELDGTINWGLTGDLVDHSLMKQQAPKIVPTGNKSALTAWIDGRSSGKEEITGIYAQLISTTTGIDDHSAVPSPIRRMVNYPNPFNPETTISYSLKTTADIELSVYNLRGQRVATLAQGRETAGDHSVVWNGTDANGHSVGNGVYFYRLSANGKSDVRKMVLMK